MPLAFLLGASAPAKPDWHVLTSLPLFMGNGSIGEVLGGKSKPSPFILKFGERRHLLPIDTLNEAQLAKAQRLLLIQPWRVPGEELVAFDAWVRKGGRALIFADPDLTWPHPYQLGDDRAPPPSTLLDPLFNHWGLRLDGIRSQPKLSNGRIGGHRVALANQGRWRMQRGVRGCSIRDAGLVATCRLGSGRVVLIADVDMANPAIWHEPGRKNPEAIESLFVRLESAQP